MRVHLLDGTYELFRHHFGQPPRKARDGTEVGALGGVIHSVVSMLSEGATHIGVGTDHIIESFRNQLWPGYKTGAGVPAELKAQFVPLEHALEALGVIVWPMVDLEADDALASAAVTATADTAVDQVIICSPDKDMAQCVTGRRVVMLNRRDGTITDEDGVRAKFGVSPGSIPDWLALVGDSADGFPGIAGWGKRSAATVLAHYVHLDAIPDRVGDWDPALRRALRGAERLAAQLAADRDQAMLFRVLATLRTDPSLLTDVAALRWRGPTPAFAEVCANLREPALEARVAAIEARA